MSRAERALAAALLLASSPIAGAIAAPTHAEELRQGDAVPDSEFRAIMSEAGARLQSNDCAGALERLDPLALRLEGDERRGAVQLLRIPCLGMTGRGEEMATVHDELATIAPDNPLVQAFGVLASLQRERFTEAGERMAALAEANPAALDALGGNALRGILQKLGEAEEHALIDRIYIAIARASWQPADMPELGESIATGAIGPLLDQGAADEARTILRRITAPEQLFSMAIERRYEALWPDIERLMGPESGAAIDRYALARLEEFSRNPADSRALRDAARAFVLLNRNDEAAEIAANVTIAAGMDEYQVATVRYHAYALAAGGRRGEAVARLAGFEALEPEAAFSLASGIVGLAEMLDEDRQFAEALRVAREALADASGWLSPYGRAWLRRTEICALAGLGRQAEAAPLAAALAGDARDNEAAAIEALLCLGESDRAARIAVATLATTEGASSIADQFQPDAAIGVPAISYLRALWQPFLERPDVRAAFEAKLRILPEALWPGTEARAIPRTRVPDGMPVT